MSYTNRYRARGMARPVDPGIDVSHYGAPYQGMLGVGCMGCSGLGQEAWTAAPGQMQSADPRYLKRYSKVVLSYTPSRIPSGSAGPDALRNKVAAAFPGQTVRKAWSNGWGTSGKLGVEVTLATPKRIGEIKQLSKGIEGSLSGTGLTNASVSGARVALNAGDIMSAEERMAHTGGAVTPPSTGVAPLVTDPGEGDTNFLTQTAAGLPVWGWGLLGIGTLAAVGVVVAVSGKPRAAAVKANRRRRPRRRSTRRNARRKTAKPRKDPKWRVRSSERQVRGQTFGVGPEGPYFVVPPGIGYINTPAALGTYKDLYGKHWR